MKIVKLDNQGRGITYLDNMVVFVDNALIDEDVDIEITLEKKKYKEAKVKKINETSKERITPKCPYYDTCGGCRIMHMNYDYQEEFKLNKVKEILKKYANIETDIKMIKNDKALFYRNKVTLKVENGKWGYYSYKTHELTEINTCLIASHAINEIITNHQFLNIQNGEITIRSNYEDKILISIITDEEVNLESVPDNIVGIVLNDKTIYKDNYFFDYIADFKFKVSYNSFFQVNNYMAGRIFDIIKNNLNGDNLLDLYCGVGTLGIAVANNFKNIYGVEKINNAINDAKENYINNNIKNAHLYVGDTAKITKDINKEFDTIIVDPPRSGLNEATMNYLLEVFPKTLCYVSCDPMTLARDLKVLTIFYNIRKINVLDMFPNTHHIESIVILDNKEI